MNHQATITNEQLNEFCSTQKLIQADIKALTASIKELKINFEQQRKDFAAYRSDMGDVISRGDGKLDTRIDNFCASMCQTIGEVPSGKSVMACVRDIDERVDKVNGRMDRWNTAFIIIMATIEFLANYPRIADLFH